jgi:hypothetical protein
MRHSQTGRPGHADSLADIAGATANAFAGICTDSREYSVDRGQPGRADRGFCSPKFRRKADTDPYPYPIAHPEPDPVADACPEPHPNPDRSTHAESSDTEPIAHGHPAAGLEERPQVHTDRPVICRQRRCARLGRLDVHRVWLRQGIDVHAVSA